MMKTCATLYVFPCTCR